MADQSAAFRGEIPCIATFQAPDEINSVSWSPDGTRLAIGDDASGVEVLTAEGRSLWRRELDTTRIWCVQWSPNGRTLASAAAEGSIRVWGSESGEDTQLAEDGEHSQAVCWSPDTDRLAWASGIEVRIMLLPEGQAIHGQGHSMPARGLAWSPDGSLVASGSWDESIRFWEGKTGIFVKSFASGDRVRALNWSPDGRRLASCGKDKVQIWDTQDGRCTASRKFDGFTEWQDLESVSWSPHGEVIAVGGDDHRVRILDPRDCREIAIVEGHSSVVWSVAFSPDGTRLASASGDNTLKIWNVEALGMQRVPRPRASEGSLYIARQAATVGRRITPRVQGSWVPHLPEASGDCLGVLRRAAPKASYHPSLDVSADGFTMVSGHEDGSLRRWELRTGETTWEAAQARETRIIDVRMSPDGARIASISSNSGGSIGMWDARTAEQLWVWKTGESPGLQIAWSPDSRRVAAGFKDQCLRVFGADHGEIQWEGSGHLDWLWAVAWSPDGRYLASASGDGSLKIWDSRSGACIRTLGRPLAVNSVWVTDVKWSPQGDLLTAGYRPAAVEVWDTRTWEIRLRYQGHVQAGTNGVSVAWSPDGRLIASAAREGQIRIWEAATGRDLVEFPLSEKTWRLAWAQSGAFLASSHFGEVFRFWDTRSFLSEFLTDVVGPAKEAHAPRELLALPRALAELHRLGIHPPLSLLHDLLALTGGTGKDGPAAALAGDPGIRSLASLRWPTPARVGLAVLLLRNVPLNGWEPPPDLTPGEMAAALTHALHYEAVEPDAPPPPVAALQNAADAIDDRLLTLLEMLGAEAVATDPGLPLRLIPRLPSLPPLTAAQRRLLGLRLQSGASGRSLGHGPGSERSGVELRGDLRSLLPSQLALPAPLLASRYLRGELLYRARTGEESPRLRPAVLVLDVSPASFGPVEATTRLAAHLVASSLLAAGLPVVVVLAGGSPSTQLIERPGDIAQLWIARSMEPAEAVRTLRVARTMRETLRDGPLEPIVLLLTHTWFGAEEEAAALPALRGLFVQFPGYQARPPLAALCERWESLPAGSTEGLADVLGRLAR